MRWTEPSCALTTEPLLPRCCDRSEWSCHGFLTLPLYMTFSSWPFRTNCPYYWCSALPTPPSTSYEPWCRRRRGSSKCVCVSLCGLLFLVLKLVINTDSLILHLYLFLCISGVHEDDGSQQLAPLERLVPHVLPLPLHFGLFCHCAPLYPGELMLPITVTSATFQHVMPP